MVAATAKIKNKHVYHILLSISQSRSNRLAFKIVQICQKENKRKESEINPQIFNVCVHLFMHCLVRWHWFWFVGVVQNECLLIPYHLTIPNSIREIIFIIPNRRIQCEQARVFLSFGVSMLVCAISHCYFLDVYNWYVILDFIVSA